MTKGVISDEGNTGNGCTKSGGKTDDKQVEKEEGENPATHGGETEPPRRTWDWVPQRKVASRCHRRPETPKSKRRTRVASTQQESKAFLMQRTRQMCAHSGGGARCPQDAIASNGNRPGKGRVVEECGAQCEHRSGPDWCKDVRDVKQRE